ncbi:MAG: hypothetical protein GX593_14510, partial [Actinomycetales bacterium]|nr:hypothetical protein [Actinomycetales bacterium]
MPPSPIPVAPADPTTALVRARTTSLSTWQHTASDSFVPLAVHSDRPREFRADLVGCVSDGVLFSTISASAHAVERGL